MTEMFTDPVMVGLGLFIGVWIAAVKMWLSPPDKPKQRDDDDYPPVIIGGAF